MIRDDVRGCDYCQRPIRSGQRWVREKIYAPPSPNQVPAYRHFHAEPVEAQAVSCWERRWIERELARMAGAPGNAGTAQAVTLLN